jgi:hypothetical protein
MNQRIVYQMPGAPASILIPCDCGLTLEQIGKKDVPQGVPFWIVPADSIPADRTFRDAWELDAASMGEPSGFGGAA